MLAYNAPRRVRVLEPFRFREEATPCTIASLIFSLVAVIMGIWVTVDFFSSGESVSVAEFVGFLGAAAFPAASLMAARCHNPKYRFDDDTYRAQATKLYYDLNNDHKILAQPVLNQMYVLGSSSASGTNEAIYDRLQLIRQLKDKQDVDTLAALASDHDTRTLKEYLTNPSLQSLDTRALD